MDYKKKYLKYKFKYLNGGMTIIGRLNDINARGNVSLNDIIDEIKRITGRDINNRGAGHAENTNIQNEVHDLISAVSRNRSDLFSELQDIIAYNDDNQFTDSQLTYLTDYQI